MFPNHSGATLTIRSFLFASATLCPPTASPHPSSPVPKLTQLPRVSGGEGAVWRGDRAGLEVQGGPPRWRLHEHRLVSPRQERTGFQLLREAVKTTPGQRGSACSGASEPRPRPAARVSPPQGGDRDDLAREKLAASGRPPPPPGRPRTQRCLRRFHRGHWSSGLLAVSSVLRHFLFHLRLIHTHPRLPSRPPAFLETEKGERERKP